MKKTRRARTAPSKVFWSDAEKAKVISCAMETQATDPALAGLPLLRAAMRCLPAERRRKLIAISQADWFDPGLALAYQIRDQESKAPKGTIKVVQSEPVRIDYQTADNPYLSHMKTQADALAAVVDATKGLAEKPVKACIIEHASDPYVPLLAEIAGAVRESRDASKEFHDKLVVENNNLLRSILDEMRVHTALIAKIVSNGSPTVPRELEAESPPPPNSYEAQRAAITGYTGRRMETIRALGGSIGHRDES